MLKPLGMPPAHLFVSVDFLSERLGRAVTHELSGVAKQATAGQHWVDVEHLKVKRLLEQTGGVTEIGTTREIAVDLGARESGVVEAVRRASRDRPIAIDSDDRKYYSVASIEHDFLSSGGHASRKTSTDPGGVRPAARPKQKSLPVRLAARTRYVAGVATFGAVGAGTPALAYWTKSDTPEHTEQRRIGLLNASTAVWLIAGVSGTVTFRSQPVLAALSAGLALGGAANGVESYAVHRLLGRTQGTNPGGK